MAVTDDNDMDMASSAVSDLDAQEKTAEAAAPVDATSSSATGENAVSDTLSIVRDVVSDKSATDGSAPPADDEVGQDADATGKAKEPDEENFSDVPFNKHPRFQQLLRQAKANKADAERYQNVQTFIDNHGLSAEEAADMLVIGGLMKTNPAEAWRRAKPLVQQLLVAAGEVLPEDLKGRVQKGEMSADAALEVSRARAGVQSVEATRSFEQQRAAQTQAQQAATAVVTAAEDWEARRRRNDPNFETKLQPLMKEVAYLQMSEGKPNTPEGVKAQLDRAYKALVPPPAARPAVAAVRPTPTPVTGGQVAGNTAPKPQSTIDIIRQRVGRG